MFFSGRPLRWQALRKTGQLLAVTVAMLSTASAEAREQTVAPTGTVVLAELPPEAAVTYRSILSGGPFPGRKDGSVFGNRERMLPAEPRGFYHEYTVPTPGARDRGARRIVCGGKTTANPVVCFYTGDHYASFRRIRP